MTRIGLLAVAVLAVACSSPRDLGDGGSPQSDANDGVVIDAGSDDVGSHDAGLTDAGMDEMDGGSETEDAGVTPPGYANVRGTVQYHPQELRWRATQTGAKANPPSLVGATVNVEDAIKAQGGGTPLKTVALSVAADGRSGTFVAGQVYVKGTTLALVASVEMPPPANPNDDTLLFSGYELARPPFQTDLNDLPVYVVSKGFVQHLADVIGHDFSTMLDEGVVLGGASNWTHSEGVAGARLVRLYGTGASARIEEITEDLFYFNSDLSALQSESATSSSGLWIRLSAGSMTTHTMLEKDATKYQEAGKKVFNARLFGSRAGTVVSVFFEDLATKP